jgi:outer membrane protein
LNALSLFGNTDKLMRFLFFILFSFISAVAFSQDSWTLEKCIEHALTNNISIKQSELSLEINQIDRKEAIGGLLPNLNAQGGFGFNWGQRIDPFTNQFASERIESGNVGIATSVNLFSGFRQWNLIKRAELSAEAGKWNLEKMKNDIALNVATAFLNVVINQEVLAIAESNLSASDAQATRISKLVAAGSLAEGNLNDILAQRASDDASRVAAENNVYLAKLSLIQLLQLSLKPEAFSIVVPNIEDLESARMIENVDVIVSSAVNNFPEIKSAQANLLVAEYNTKIAKSGAYPSLNASYSYGSGYSGAARVLNGSPDSLAFPVGQVFGSGDIVFSFPQPVFSESDYAVKPLNDQLRDNVNRSFFVNLNIPIFNGFSNRSAIKRAQVNQIISNYQLEQSKLTLTQNVERAYADTRAALSNYNAAKISLDASDKAMKWAEARYTQGASNLVEYNDARVRLDNARANMLRNKYDFLFKLKVLDFYMGQPINLK